MILDPLADTTSATLSAALDALSARQRVTADNIANASTPNFRARRLAFEQSLAAATAAGAPERYSATTHLAATPVKLDGNSVDLVEEFNDMTRTQLAYQAVVGAMSYKVGVLRAALAR